jgi:hypothetical protein
MFFPLSVHIVFIIRRLLRSCMGVLPFAHAAIQTFWGRRRMSIFRIRIQQDADPECKVLMPGPRDFNTIFSSPRAKFPPSFRQFRHCYGDSGQGSVRYRVLNQPRLGESEFALRYSSEMMTMMIAYNVLLLHMLQFRHFEEGGRPRIFRIRIQQDADPECRNPGKGK